MKRTRAQPWIVDGVTLHCYIITGNKLVWASEDGRVRVGRNPGRNRWATVDGKSIGENFRTTEMAARAAVNRYKEVA